MSKTLTNDPADAVDELSCSRDSGSAPRLEITRRAQSDYKG